MNKRPHREAGFTLIEMLVSLFIFSLIAAGTMTAMSNSLSMRERVNIGMDSLNQLNASRAIMRNDFERLSLRQRRDILGSFEPYVLTTDNEALIEFTRLGRENPGGLEARGDAERVAYIFEEGNLIRQSWPSANPDVSSKPHERLLFENLKSARIEFMSGNLIPISRLAIGANASENLPGVIQFILTDDRDMETTHIFELRG
jgi:general secretion pathway protein J